MKKKLFALLCAVTMTFAMSLTAFAAPSVNTGDVVEEEDDDDEEEEAKETVVVEDVKTADGQQITVAVVEDFAKTTTVTSTVEATISAVTSDTAKAAAAQAKAVVGDNAALATVVDLSVPEGTGEASFTLNVPKVAAGQSVTILHQKKDGTWETIKPTNVANGSVTFTLTSYSPVAVVINATAPKTGDMVMAVAALAMVSLTGSAAALKKAKKN